MADSSDHGAPRAPRVRPLILAAGAATRFGGAKLSARVDGKPILRHVIDTVAVAGLARPVVVIGPEPPVGVDLEGAETVRNWHPERGLASSLHVGWEVAANWPLVEGTPDAVVVLLGDQPLVRSEVLRRLAAEPLDSDRPIVAPRYGGSDAHNPVRVELAAGGLVEAADGDRGLGPIIAAHPELVRWLDVDGENPDVDTAADLAHVADLVWADRVRRNREQVDRFREEPDGRDFYAKVSSIFREDPDRAGDPVLEALLAHARPDDTWLDIGAGAGRYALPLARAVRMVIALDPSPSMLGGLREAMVEHNIDNVEVVQGRWPGAEQGSGSPAAALSADVTLIAHVGYDVDAIWPFLEAMERVTRRECLAVLMERSPATLAEPFWPEVHGEPRIALPALPALVDLLAAHGRTAHVRMLESSRRRWASREEVETYVRRQTWVRPGSAKDRRMQALIGEWLVRHEDGSVELSTMEPLRVGLVAWRPA